MPDPADSEGMESLLNNLGYLVIFFVFLAIAKPMLKAAIRRERQRANGEGQSDSETGYESREFLLTQTENTFFKGLQSALKNEYSLFSKVRVEDVIKAKQQRDRSKYNSLRGRIKSRHFDFVACDPETSKIEFIVELDDASHGRASAKKTDAFKDAIADSSGIPLLRFVPGDEITEEEITNRISVKTAAIPA